MRSTSQSFSRLVDKMVEENVHLAFGRAWLLVSRLAHLLMSLHRLVIHWLEYVVSAGSDTHLRDLEHEIIFTDCPCGDIGTSRLQSTS